MWECVVFLQNFRRLSRTCYPHLHLEDLISHFACFAYWQTGEDNSEVRFHKTQQKIYLSSFVIPPPFYNDI